MPANLTPQYHKAEQAYKEAETVQEKIAALEEMLAVIPKHKGTDHLQGDLRRRLAKLRQEASRPKVKKAFNPFRVERGGAGQVVVLGAPNSGKSALVAKVTNAPTAPAAFPFATQGPVPGMMAFEDVQVQLVDLPPMAREYCPAGMLGLIKAADAALLLADLGAETVLEDLEACLEILEGGGVCLSDPGARESSGGQAEALFAPGAEGALAEPSRPRVQLPARLLASKIDLPGAREKLGVLQDLYRGRFQPLAISSENGEGFDRLPALVFALLDRVRVYTKLPGEPPDRSAPFVLRRGQSVLDLASAIHRDFAQHVRQARVWGSARFDGQAVEKDYVLQDKDVVELHVDMKS